MTPCATNFRTVAPFTRLGETAYTATSCPKAETCRGLLWGEWAEARGLNFLTTRS